MADDIDRADARIEAFLSSSLDAALAPFRNAAPSDGICKTCGADIEPDRLAALPMARDCKDCAQDLADMTVRQRRTGRA